MPETNPAPISADLQEEIWKTVIEYEDLYEVSNQGRVRRIAPYSYNKWRGDRGRLPRVLKPSSNRGYPQVALYSWDGRGKKTHAIHRLVASAFLGPCPPHKQHNHIDGNKKNNGVTNLEYITPSENVRHAQRLGLIRKRERGYENPTAKLSEQQVEIIRQKIQNRVPYRLIAEEFSISAQTVCNVKKGKCYPIPTP